MPLTLTGKHIAILATNGFELVELTEPKRALEAAGAKVTVISPSTDPIQGYNHDKPAEKVKVDLLLSSAKAAQFDALVLPGGVANPDTLRINPLAITFIREFGADGKPIAAICHGPWTLIEAKLVTGRRITSWPSLKTDLINAGATWVDEEVVVDRGLITSRKPDDLPAFNTKMIEAFAAGSVREHSWKAVAYTPSAAIA